MQKDLKSSNESEKKQTEKNRTYDVRENTPKVAKIPFGKFCIDSFKLSIDKVHFKSTNIPINQSLIDDDTGEVIESFKKHSIRVDYNNQKIYIGSATKKLRDVIYDKVIILFSSNVAGGLYFDGITKNVVIDVLNHLKTLGKVDFDDVNNVYENIYATDVDIKQDYLFERSQIPYIIETNKRLKETCFKHDSERCQIYNNKTEGVGVQCNHRDNSTYTKPFIKFYDKYGEMKKRHPELYEVQSDDVKETLQSKFVYRYEYTIKNKDYFKKFELSNRLADILELPQEKFKEMARYFYDANFGIVLKKPKNFKGMNFSDRVMALDMFDNIQQRGMNIQQIMERYLSCADTKNNHKGRAEEKFNKIYSYITASENQVKLKDNSDFLNRWAEFLCF